MLYRLVDSAGEESVVMVTLPLMTLGNLVMWSGGENFRLLEQGVGITWCV